MRSACAVFVVLSFWVPLVEAKICSQSDTSAADAMVDRADSWVKINKIFIKYGHCDDGEIAEGNAEAIAKLLIDQWQTLPQLHALIKHNPLLKEFVLRHINATLDTVDLDKIKALSASSCPFGMERLCQDFSNAVSQAQKQ